MILDIVRKLFLFLVDCRSETIDTVRHLPCIQKWVVKRNVCILPMSNYWEECIGSFRNASGDKRRRLHLLYV